MKGRRAGPPEAPSGASTPRGKAQHPPSARKATGGTRAAASHAEAEVRQQEEAAQQTATQPEAQSPKKPETRWDRIRHFIRRHVTQGNNDSMD